MNDWISVLRGVTERMATTGVSELDLIQGDLRIRLRRNSDLQSAAGAATLPSPGAAAMEQETLHKVKAPLTGVFYAAPNPASNPYVVVGDWVEPDTIIGLVETMKVFNEVTADCSGRVAAIVAKPGDLLNAGDTIILVDTGAVSDRAEGVTA